MMGKATVAILVALVALNHAADAQDKLIDRALPPSDLDDTELDDTTVAKGDTSVPSCCVCDGCDGCSVTDDDEEEDEEEEDSLAPEDDDYDDDYDYDDDGAAVERRLLDNDDDDADEEEEDEEEEDEEEEDSLAPEDDDYDDDYDDDGAAVERRLLAAKKAKAKKPKKAKAKKPAAKKKKKKAKKPAAKKKKKKAKRVSKIAKGKFSKALVLRGSKVKTTSGLTADKLVKNKRGRIVSKKQSARGKQVYQKNGLKAWTAAVMQARKELKATGFVSVNGKTKLGKDIYARAKQLFKKRGSTGKAKGCCGYCESQAQTFF